MQTTASGRIGESSPVLAAVVVFVTVELPVLVPVFVVVVPVPVVYPVPLAPLAAILKFTLHTEVVPVLVHALLE